MNCQAHLKVEIIIDRARKNIIRQRFETKEKWEKLGFMFVIISSL